KILVKSITTDNGLEFKALGIAAKRLGVKLYKCDPYCSFQRGSNERMNAIVRRFIPKGKSLYQVEQQYLEDIMFKINEMPRKIFDFKTPHEVEFNKMISGAVEIT
ncbi:IS30 family transposase, partial [Bacilli bacterium PM5-9]|nr:IS30 family transposase [Bacilli bacterium PM5-9]